MQSINIKGFVRLRVFDKDGNLKQDTGSQENTITKAGLAQIALLAGDASAAPFTYLALGTDDTAVTADDTALGAEITDTGLARAAATISRITTTVTNDTLRATYTWTATGVKTIEETGLFNAASSGTMLGHKLTGTSTTANADEVEVTYDIKFA